MLHLFIDQADAVWQCGLDESCVCLFPFTVNVLTILYCTTKIRETKVAHLIYAAVPHCIQEGRGVAAAPLRCFSRAGFYSLSCGSMSLRVRLILPVLASMSMTRTSTCSPMERTSSTFSTRLLAMREMCSKSVRAGFEVDERAEFLDAYHGAEVNVANFDFLDDAVDDALGFRRRCRIRRRNVNRAVVLDIDLYAGIGDDLVDRPCRRCR